MSPVGETWQFAGKALQNRGALMRLPAEAAGARKQFSLKREGGPLPFNSRGIIVVGPLS